MKRIQWLFFFGLGSCVFLPGAYAYIDPGTGSYLFQILAAMVLGSLFGIKMAWNRIVETVRGLFGLRSRSEDQEDDL